MLRACARRIATPVAEVNSLVLPSLSNSSKEVSLFSTRTKEPFQTTPQPLNFEHPVDSPHPWVENSTLGRFALSILGYYSRSTRLQQGALRLYSAIQSQAENVFLQQQLSLPPKFATIHSLLCLHVWLVLGRLRPEGKDGKDLSQEMYDLFQEDVEKRVRKEGVKVRVGKWLSDLETTFYGGAQAYDKALKGEGNFAEALMRNVYGKEGSMRDAKRLERYLRREIACLAMTDSEAVLGGQIRFTIDF
ncbi:hypothetical protein BSKO_10140 [Bryopsis sp. KO-2023]|nr:hypothetical protein BSKO_10140 [Bryopsis sp. KO-2023]